MPYKDKYKDRTWHRNYMRTKRMLLKSVSKNDFVTPSVTPKLDADGNIIYDN